MKQLPIAVGYWRSDEEPELPDPRTLVDDTWQSANQHRIVKYLKTGHEYMAELGCSWCRFKCGIDDSELGL